MEIATVSTSTTTVFMIEGFSSYCELPTRGHFKVLIGTGTNNKRMDVITATNGLTKGSFDYREVSANVYEVWFYMPQFTTYNCMATKRYGATPSFTTANEAGTPSGTELTVA